MQTVTLRPPAHLAPAYPIHVGTGALSALPELLQSLQPVDGVFVLHDRAVTPLAQTVAASVQGTLIAVESGEASKTLAEADRICRALLDAKATRRSILVTVGGGMLTDLGGFVASVYQRGIRVIHIPTSMLAMVDAAIGGKTAVDLGEAKNMVGTMHHPVGIIADIDTLQSLGQPQLCEGIVEAVKAMMMLDAGMFAWIETHLPLLLARDPEALTTCVTASARLKADVVAEDERDDNRRLFLNFGHTVGHAVEALSGFRIAHGRAVSIGMMAEMRLAKTPGAERMESMLNAMDMPLEIPAEMNTDELWNLMRSDKKSVRGEVRMAVPAQIGQGEVRPITEDAFRQLRA
jgi:3-dehydroquinate synthase